MFIIWKGTYCIRGHVWCRYLRKTMHYHIIIIFFKNNTFHFARPSVLNIVSVVFKFLLVTITPCEQLIIHNFWRYTTLTTTHNLVTCIFFLSWVVIMFHISELLMIFSSLAFFIPLSSGVLTMLVCISLTNTCNNSLCTTYF